MIITKETLQNISKQYGISETMLVHWYRILEQNWTKGINEVYTYYDRVQANEPNVKKWLSFLKQFFPIYNVKRGRKKGKIGSKYNISASVKELAMLSWLKENTIFIKLRKWMSEEEAIHKKDNIKQLAIEKGLNINTVYSRLRKWKTLEEALEQKVRVYIEKG